MLRISRSLSMLLPSGLLSLSRLFDYLPSSLLFYASLSSILRNLDNLLRVE
jgi:hypothetical protein